MLKQARAEAAESKGEMIVRRVYGVAERGLMELRDLLLFDIYKHAAPLGLLRFICIATSARVRGSGKPPAQPVVGGDCGDSVGGMLSDGLGNLFGPVLPNRRHQSRGGQPTQKSHRP